MSPMHPRYWRNMLVLGSIILVGWGIYEAAVWVAEMMGGRVW